jgi:hypothetical protein
MTPCGHFYCWSCLYLCVKWQPGGSETAHCPACKFEFILRLQVTAIDNGSYDTRTHVLYRHIPQRPDWRDSIPYSVQAQDNEVLATTNLELHRGLELMMQLSTIPRGTMRRLVVFRVLKAWEEKHHLLRQRMSSLGVQLPPTPPESPRRRLETVTAELVPLDDMDQLTPLPRRSRYYAALDNIREPNTPVALDDTNELAGYPRARLSDSGDDYPPSPSLLGPSTGYSPPWSATGRPPWSATGRPPWAPVAAVEAAAADPAPVAAVEAAAADPAPVAAVEAAVADPAPVAAVEAAVAPAPVAAVEVAAAPAPVAAVEAAVADPVPQGSSRRPPRVRRGPLYYSNSVW